VRFEIRKSEITIRLIVMIPGRRDSSRIDKSQSRESVLSSRLEGGVPTF